MHGMFSFLENQSSAIVNPREAVAINASTEWETNAVMNGLVCTMVDVISDI